jgi:hypothetical protein
VKTNVFTLSSKPGVKRDGTDLDNEYFQDAQWVRFQRGRPRKIGGYRAMSQILSGPIRAVDINARSPSNFAHVFSPWGVERLEFDSAGIGGGLVDRTPSGLPYNANYNWQVDSMFNNGGGGAPVLVCASAPDLDSIASDAVGKVYSGDSTGTGALTVIQDGAGDIQVSGGCCVLQPFLFVYGSDGLIRNSNANDFSVATGWSGTNANIANVSGKKIVKGLPVRGGGDSPAGLFWALDSLIRVSYIGGTSLWKYDPVSAQISVLSKSAILEYDGVFFWPGVDRFYMYTGVVQELPNPLSSNYFFENLNYAAAQKVWAMRVPRFGEIWWFYPSGSNTECDKVLIFNVREGLWYDSEHPRSAGAPAQVFRYPLMAGGEPLATVRLKYTVGVGTFAAGMTVIGSTSGATGKIVRALPGQLNLVEVVGTFVNAEAIHNPDSSSTGLTTSGPIAQQLDILWQHEYLKDKIKGEEITAVRAYFETNNFQWASGGPVEETAQGAASNTRVKLMEPDFLSSGELTVTVRGRKYAQSPVVSGEPHTFSSATEYVSLRDQFRQVSLKVESNILGGDFQMGKVFITAEPGDERA